jgi:TonB family protein
MLTTLLESRPNKTSDKSGAITSVALHATIIFAAVYATATAGVAKDEPLNPPTLHWVRTPPPPVTSTPLPDRSATSSTTAPAANPLVVPIEIPTSLPSIILDAPPVTSSDFVRGSPNNSGAPSQATAAGGKRAYDASEVEVAVSSVGTTAPEYPSALRNAGVEGKVVAEFVVTELGRADARSLRIISATNEGFVNAIRQALPRMRFSPARIGDHAVPQLVQQLFVFKLDR